MTDLRDIRHVVWDWNGTLLDDAWLCVEVMNELLARRGLPALTMERYQARFVFPVRDYYAELGFDFTIEPFESVGTEFIERYQAREADCDLQQGAREVLARIEATGRSQSVLSASEQRRLKRQARRLGVDVYFERLAGLDDHYAGGKVALGRVCMAELGIEPAQVLLVGDTDHDWEVARDLGIRCVLVPSGHQSPDRLRATGAPVLDSLEALPL